MTEVRTCFHCGGPLASIAIALRVNGEYQLWHMDCVQARATHISLTLSMAKGDVGDGAM